MQKSTFKLSLIARCTLPALVLFSAHSFATGPALSAAELVVPELSQQAATGPATRFIVTFKTADGSTMSEAAATGLTEAQIKSHVNQELTALVGEQMQYVREMALPGRHVIQVNRTMSKAEISQMLELISEDANVANVDLDKMLHHWAAPNDAQYTSQWHYYETTGGLRAPAAWDTATGTGVVVAVLDTGYRPHADLNANIVAGYDMISDTFVANDGGGRDSDAKDPGDWVTANQCGGTHAASNSSWHGTHVAGTIAAVTNNGTGVAGVAYGAKVMPVRVLGKCGGYTSDIADGIIWASGGTVSGVPTTTTPAKVINMSLGGEGACDSTTQAAINSARSRGTVIIIASGNDNANANNYNPGNCSGVVNVASTNRSGGRAYYSNYGTTIDVAAPGGAQNSANDSNGVLSTHNSGTTTPGSDTYQYMQGTSMAAPHVAGVAALIKQKKPAATPDEIETILKTTTRSFPATCTNCGTGIVDATAAVAAATGSTGGTPTTSTVNNISVAKNAWVYYTLPIPTGTTSLSISISGGSGDADLYVRRGANPTSSTYDCRPYKTGSTETCSFTNPTSGTYHIGIFGYAAVSGLTLTATYQ